MSAAILCAATLWQRELVRFYRQPSRVVGALASPLMFWLLLGSGIGTSFRSGKTSSYLAYFFPGTLLMILFFTAIFSTISIIEDRREGFLQSVLVAPVPRFSVVLGKVLGGSTLALIQAALFLLLAPFAGAHPGIAGWLRAIPVLFLNGFLLTCLGFIVAWRFQSIQGFHAVMNLFLMPLWILSGALFPPEGASIWIRTIMKFNPLSYGLDALRASLNGGAMGHSFVISLVFAVLLFALASFTARRNQAGDLI